MEKLEHVDKYDLSSDAPSCSSPGTFFNGSRIIGNLSMSNRNSVLTDDSGVFEDVISKSDSFESELFGDATNSFLPYSSPIAHPHKSESADSPEQLEVCMNPLFMLDTWSSPQHAKRATQTQTNTLGNTATTYSKDANKAISTQSPASTGELQFSSERLALKQGGRFVSEETTPTPAKKLVQESASLSNSPMHDKPKTRGYSHTASEEKKTKENRRRISYIECDSVEALNDGASFSRLNIYLDDGYSNPNSQSTLTCNSSDGFFEDNPFYQGYHANPDSGSKSSHERQGQNRRQSDTTPQLRSQQPSVSMRYEKAHLYPKKYGKTENMPEHQIYVELHQLEEMLKELQVKGMHIEQVLHCIAKETGPKSRSEESILLGEWLELVRSKNRIVRRENELMHMLNQRELEELQEAITSQLRHLMTIEKKSQVEATEEERLLANLLQVVEKRNAIVQVLEQDRLNEEVEDQKCEDLLSPEKLRDATTRQKTWRSVMSNFRHSKWANNVKSYYNATQKNF